MLGLASCGLTLTPKIVSAGIAIVVAWRTISYSRLGKLLLRYRKNYEGNPPIITDVEYESFKTIQYSLNYYELIAVGIDNRILDEGFYFDWMRSGYVETWRQSRSFIDKWRELTSYGWYFSRLEYYARKWQLRPFKRSIVHYQILKLQLLDRDYRPPP
jgi:Domain of unknown function (DUF4760)